MKRRLHARNPGMARSVCSLAALGFVAATLLLVMSGVDALQRWGHTVSYQEFRITEHNAAARTAVAYDSGANFVDALNRAGVPCTNPTILPVTTPAVAGTGTIQVGDSLACTFARDDSVNVIVASPDYLGHVYFSSYFEASQKALADVSSQQITLKGEFWVATSSDDQRLFEIQDVMGGQLIVP